MAIHSPEAMNETTDEEERVIRRVFRRMIWFLFALFIFSYLDRINLGFGALSMNKDLGLTATTFGIANSVFYIAYIFAEIPSNLMMQRYGARIWIPRIMITWGIASTATLFAVGPNSLYVIRFFVGLAEAGFVPAVLLYMTFWFPRTHLAEGERHLHLGAAGYVDVRLDAVGMAARCRWRDGPCRMALAVPGRRSALRHFRHHRLFLPVGQTGQGSMAQRSGQGGLATRNRSRTGRACSDKSYSVQPLGA